MADKIRATTLVIGVHSLRSTAIIITISSAICVRALRIVGNKQRQELPYRKGTIIMALISKQSLFLAVVFIVSCHSFSPHLKSNEHSQRSLQLDVLGDQNVMDNFGSSRRNAIISTVLTAMTIGTPKSQASETSSASFTGTYTDPINHPGGKRTIKLLDSPTLTGDYTLAQVIGGGGIGEPKDYVLPAVILGDRAIIIDFSPKGGPRDFTGVLEKDGSIRFLRDGNRWPRIE